MNTRVEKKFREAAEKRYLCELTDDMGRVRVVAPLGEFYTQLNTKAFAVYQYSGYSSQKEKLPAFRSLPASGFRRIKILDIRFQVQKDFHPENKQVYHKWIWHLPKPERHQYHMVHH